MLGFALQEKAENILLSENLLLATLRNHSDKLFHLLLAPTWTTIEITDSVIRLIYTRKSVTSILLHQPRIIVSLTEELLITSVQDLHPSVMA